MAQITREFDEPYSNLPQALPSSFGASAVGINGRPYLIDNTGGTYRRQAVDVVQQRNSNDNRDLLLLPQDVWRQMQQSWSFGAGQSNIDRDNALPYRYEDSFGIDPWEQWQFRLLPSTKRWLTLEGNIWINTARGSDGVDYIVVYNGSTMSWYSQLGGTLIGSRSFAPNTILDIASDALIPTVLLSNGDVRQILINGATSTVPYDHKFSNATMIAYEKDFLVCGINNVFHDITSGTAITVYTHPNSSFRWVSCASGNSAIYALGGFGDKWVIHRTRIVPDGTNDTKLEPLIVAAELPDGEIGYSLGSYLGYIFVGTNKGVRMAQPDSNGDLTLGALIPTEGPVRCFEPQDRFVWFGKDGINVNYTPVNSSDVDLPPSGVRGLGRMDLSTFTTTALTPAWANDITTQNIADPGDPPDWVTDGEVSSVITFAGKRVFSVNGYGLFYEDTELVEAGYLVQGIMSFSVEDLKTGLYIQGKWTPLNGAVGMDVAFDSGDFQRMVKVGVQGSIRSENITLDGVQFSRLNARQVLYRSSEDTTKGPVFTRWEMRAIPVKGRASRWTLPIMNYENIEIDGVNYVRDVRDELDRLMRLVQNGGIFTLQESGRLYTVHAKDFLWQPEKLATNGQGWQGVYTMVVEEVQ